MHLPEWSSLPQTCYRVSVKWFMFNEKRELFVIDEWNSLLDIPGWWLDHGENCREWLSREIEEELSCISAISDQPLCTWIRKKKNGIFYFFVGYPCAIELSNFRPSDEALSYKRVSKKELSTLVHTDDTTFDYIIEHFDELYDKYKMIIK